MSNVRNLKNPIEKFRGIGISQDLPPKERKEIKRILDDAKQRHIADCDKDVENFRFIVVEKGDRRRVIKIKKTIPSSTNQSKPQSVDPPALTATRPINFRMELNVSILMLAVCVTKCVKW